MTSGGRKRSTLPNVAAGQHDQPGLVAAPRDRAAATLVRLEPAGPARSRPRP